MSTQNPDINPDPISDSPSERLDTLIESGDAARCARWVARAAPDATGGRMPRIKTTARVAASACACCLAWRRINMVLKFG